MKAKPTQTQAPAVAPAAPDAGSQPASTNAGAEPRERGDQIEVDMGLLHEALGITQDAPKGETADEVDDSADIAADATPEGGSEEEAPEPEPVPISEEAPQGEESEPAAEAAPEPKPSAEPEQKPHEGMQRRIDELTAARRTAEAEAAKLRERLAAAESGSRQTGTGLDVVNDLATLDSERDALLDLHEWVAANPEGGQFNGREISGEDARRISVMALRVLTRDLPAREKWLRERDQADSQARTVYPWLTNSSEGLGAAVSAKLQAMPDLQRISPGYRLLAADALVGEQLRAAGVKVTPEWLAKVTSAAKPSTPGARAPLAPTRPPMAPGKPGVMPPRNGEHEISVKHARARMLREAGSVGSLADVIAANL